MIGRKRWAGLAVIILLAGCGALRPRPLDVIATERIVLGKVNIDQLSNNEVLVDLAREDGEFSQQIYIGFGPHEFALALAPGRYRIGSIRLNGQRWAMADDPVRYLHVTFDVGDDPAVYVGTLQLLSAVGTRTEARVVDEFDATVRALRRLYTNIPSVVARSLMRAG